MNCSFGDIMHINSIQLPNNKKRIKQKFRIIDTELCCEKYRCFLLERVIDNKRFKFYEKPYKIINSIRCNHDKPIDIEELEYYRCEWINYEGKIITLVRDSYGWESQQLPEENRCIFN